jgi:hypothetical protein
LQTLRDRPEGPAGRGRAAILAAVATFRDIKTNQADVSCDVCGRTLLRGEAPVTFLTGGQRRHVCELCTARAAHEGWIREAGGDELGVAKAGGDGSGRSLIGRLRQRRERASAAPPPVHEQQELDPAIAAELVAGEHPAVDPSQPPPPPRRRRVTVREPEPPPEARGGAEGEPPREPRHVRAVPTNAELKMVRALEVFNGSEHVRTVGGVARSLGPPAVAVRPLPDRPSVVGITVMWELSWYQFEIDLSDEAGGVLRAARGDELSELDGADQQPVNAAADERGALVLAG